MNALFIYIIISLVVEIVSTVLGKNDDFITLAFTILEYSLITYIFWLEFERKNLRIITCVLSGLFFALTGFSIFCFNSFDLIDDISTTSEAVIIITLGILYFYKIFTDLDIPKLTNHYYFWLNSAFLLYFSTALFLFLFKSYIKKMDELAPFLWSIHLIINITYNILLAIGICKHRKT